MSIDDSPVNKSEIRSAGAGCAEHNRLLDQFGVAVQALIQLHQHQFQAILDGDEEIERFDVLIHMANEEKQLAKYAYVRHVEDHGCSKP